MLAAIRSYVRTRLAILCSEEAAKLQGRVDELTSDVQFWNEAVRHKVAFLEAEQEMADLARLERDTLAGENETLRYELNVARSTIETLQQDKLAVEDKHITAYNREQNALREIAELKQDLAEVQHKLAMNENQLELANEANRLLSKIHEGDIARREKEAAIELRIKAEAEAAARFAGSEATEE